MFKRILFTALGPNIDAAAVRNALGVLCFPWKWPFLIRGHACEHVEQRLKKMYAISYVRTLDSGRSAIQISLSVLGIGKGDSVLVQGYTCMVVVNAIHATGAQPIFVDVDNQMNMDPNDASKKMTPSTRAMIIQHTFGAAAQTELLLALARKHGLKTIEDCAHTIEFGEPKKLGTMSDIAIVSFGSDKAISSVRGGAVMTSDKQLSDALNTDIDLLPNLSVLMVIRHLLQPPLFALSRTLYPYLSIGKFLFWCIKFLHITPRTVTHQEKQGNIPTYFPAKYPNALATLLLSQLDTLERKNMHRRKIASTYAKTLDSRIIQPHRKSETPLLRYLVLTDDPEKVEARARKLGVILGDWYRTVVAPEDSNIRTAGYHTGQCPAAEYAAARSLNLPTDLHVTEEDARRIAIIVNESM